MGKDLMLSIESDVSDEDMDAYDIFRLLHGVCKDRPDMCRRGKYVMVLTKALQGALVCLREACASTLEGSAWVRDILQERAQVVVGYVQQLIQEVKGIQDAEARGATQVASDFCESTKDALKILNEFERNLSR